MLDVSYVLVHCWFLEYILLYSYISYMYYSFWLRIDRFFRFSQIVVIEVPILIIVVVYDDDDVDD